MRFNKLTKTSKLNEDKYSDTLDNVKKMISSLNAGDAPLDVGHSIYDLVFSSLRLLSQFVYKHPEFKEDYTQELSQKIYKIKSKFK